MRPIARRFTAIVLTLFASGGATAGIGMSATAPPATTARAAHARLTPAQLEALRRLHINPDAPNFFERLRAYELPRMRHRVRCPHTVANCASYAPRMHGRFAVAPRIMHVPPSRYKNDPLRGRRLTPIVIRRKPDASARSTIHPATP